ncbi:MAG: hypothetical protein V4472_25575 [Pseudomonadota bacterium]
MSNTDTEQFLWLGVSLDGFCSHCRRNVDNYDDLHRVTSIVRGGRGVECCLRGDIVPQQAAPLGHRPKLIHQPKEEPCQ